MSVSLKEIKQAKGVLHNLHIYDPEKANVIKAAVEILREELDRRKEPRFISGGQSESNRRRH